MSIEVKFENQDGQPLATRQFLQGQSLRVGGHIFGTLLPGGFVPVTLDLTFEDGSTIFDSTHANVLGDFWFDIIMPYLNTRGTLRLIAQFLTTSETVTMPISVGDVLPDPLPDPPASPLDKVLAILPWAAFALGIMYVWPKANTTKRKTK